MHPTWQRTRPNSETDKHKGWAFYDSDSGSKGLKSTSGYGTFHVDRCSKDPNEINAVYIRDLYEASNDSLGKYTVPIMFDKKRQTIVNNESSEIIRMLSTEFDEWSSGPFKNYNFCPQDLLADIDKMNDFIYGNINDGVYKCGFAQSQKAYDEACTALYCALDRVEEILSKNRLVYVTYFTFAYISCFFSL